MSATDITAAADIIRDADALMLTCHRGPDGDSIGSMVALAALRKAAGKTATLYSPDLVPRRLKWLPHTKRLIHRLKNKQRFDATVVVDCGDRKLLGADFPAAERTGTLVVLDHHASGRPFGDVWVCDPSAASVGVIVARIARHLGWAIDRDAALGMFVSMVSDTGSFRYSNTNAEAFRLAADLVESGIDPWSISERTHESASLASLKLLSAALGTIELALDGRVAFVAIGAEMIAQTKAMWEDTEGVVNYARAIGGVECGVLITPAKEGGVRVSMRSKGHLIDAGAVCLALGGGGHVGAAGCRLTDVTSLTEARAIVEKALAEALTRGTDAPTVM